MEARSPAAPEKVAVLGGGVSALTTAFALTDPALEGRYEVTVYQMGWRLGGKGASGRNPKHAQRIEEHGVHVWSGFYENAFRVIRACYDQIGRAPDAPLATWRDAFKPKNTLVVEEEHEGAWRHWIFQTPTNEELPGDPDARPMLPLSGYLSEALSLMRLWFRSHRARGATGVLLHLARLLLLVAHGLAHLLRTEISFLGRLLRPVLRLFNRLFGRPIEKLIVALLGLFIRWFWRRVRTRLDHPGWREDWTFLNFGYGNLRGLVDDDLLRRGLTAVDDQDYRAWLGRHIVDDGGLTLNSPLAKFLYDALFAFPEGDTSKPALSAHVALYTMLRLGLTSKGALIWEMQAGMGDTVFTPLYQALARRGVTFKFFHRIKQLHLDPGQASIEAVTVGRQVRLQPDVAAYQPLVSVNGLDCWPSEPLFDQIVDGDAYRNAGVNFESWCTEDRDGEVRLEAGRDFDRVVLGIPVGMHPYVCCELIEADPRWKAMVDHVRTVRTQALQLWLKPTAYELGWTAMGRPMFDTYDVSPLDTWADMTHLIDRESWPSGPDRYPQNIAYFCGPMRDDPPLEPSPCGPRASCDSLDQEAADRRAAETARRFMDRDLSYIWPNCMTEDGSAFDDRLIVSRYHRANVQPTERYVLSLPGTARHRLAPGDSGFDNLFLAGDWTRNHFNAGCIEASVISGLLAAHAMSGHPRLDRIIGLDFGQPTRRTV